VPTYRVRAFRRAAAVIEGLPTSELDRRVRDGTLATLPGIGTTTAQVITEAAGGVEPAYQDVVAESGPVEQILERPADPYTQRLVEDAPKLG
jgi:putative hydrolase